MHTAAEARAQTQVSSLRCHFCLAWFCPCDVHRVCGVLTSSIVCKCACAHAHTFPGGQRLTPGVISPSFYCFETGSFAEPEAY